MSALFTGIIILGSGVTLANAASQITLTAQGSLTEPWRWTKLEELSGFWIREIKLSKGTLWAAAAEGLLEYDGYSVKIHPLPAAPDPTGDPSTTSGILELQAAPDGSIYALTSEAILLWRDGRWSQILKIDPPQRRSGLMSIAGDGSVWAAAPNGLFRLAGENATPVPLHHGPFTTCHIDPKNNLWLAESRTGRVWRYRLDPTSRLPVELTLALPGSEPTEDRSIEIVSTADAVWICSSQTPGAAIRRIAEDRVEVISPDLSALSVVEEVRIYAMENDALLAISPGVLAEWKKGVWTFHGSELGHLPTGYPIINRIGSNRLLVTGRGDEAYEIDLSNRLWETWEGLHFAGQDRDGKQWFLAADHAVLCRPDESSPFTRYETEDGLIDQPNHLLLDSAGVIWASGSHQDTAAIAWWDGRQWTRRLHPELGRIVSHLGAVELADGRIMFGAGEQNRGIPGGVVVYAPGIPTGTGVHLTRPAVPARISSFAQTHDGSLWLSGAGLWQRSPEANAAWQSKFGQNWVDQIATDRNGELWLAMWGSGVHWLRGDGTWRHFDDTMGLASLGVVALLPQRKGPGVWLATSKGLSHFDGETWNPLPLDDGLKFEREGATLREGHDGSLWINLAYRAWFFNSVPRPTERDLTLRTVRHHGDQVPPQTYLVEGGADATEGGLLYFRWRGRDAYSRTSEARLQYSWRIDQDPWSPFTGSREYFIHQASTGSHTFAVRARDGDGNIDPTPATVTFIVQPLFWKQAWFIATVLLTVGVLVWLIVVLVRTRIRHMVAMEELQLQFFTNVSHELRNPLAVVLGPLQSLLETNRDSILHDSLQMIYRNALKLEKLVDQLLEFRSSQLGRMGLTPSRGDVVASLREFVEDYSFLWRQKGHALELDLPDQPKICRFDPVKLQHLLGNLLSNAIKYTPPHGHLRVSATIEEVAAQPLLHLSVTDNGPGIPAGKRRLIFKPFFRAVEKDSDQGGFGIGLAYVAEIVQLWGGKIRVQSPPPESPRGTRFTVTLPLLPDAPPPPRASEPPDETDPDESLQKFERTRPLVLVIEDDPDVRTFLSAELGRDYDVHTAPDGQAGLEKTIAETPDLVVLDLTMPKLDGVELCRRLKTTADTSHIPLLMLTARRAEDARLQSAQAGADSYLTKPVDLRLLRAQVTMLLESRRQLRAKFTRQIIVQPKEITITPVDEAFLSKTMAVMEAHMQDDQFDVDAFARHMAMSRMTLYRKLSAVTGQPPFRFIRTMRIKRAAQLLSTGQLGVGEVMTQVGILEPSYFSRIFREEFGMTPTEYRNRNPA